MVVLRSSSAALLLALSTWAATSHAFLVTNPASVAPPMGTTLYMHNKSSKKKRVKKKVSASSSGGGFGGGGPVSSGFPYAGSVRPGVQTPQRTVSVEDVPVQPDYASDGIPKKRGSALLPWIVEVKKPDEIVKMRAAGDLARRVLDMAGRMVKPGVTTDEIDTAVHKMIIEAGAYPSPLNYHNFPKSCCTSVNEVICHGIPDSRALEEGDIINVDITVYVDGYHGDCSEMFVAGTPSDDDRALIQATYDSWIQACQFAKPGHDYKDIGAIIEDHVTSLGFTTVKDFCGHGLGSVFHTTPNILHYRNNEPNGQMAPGHTFTIEPMICAGSAKVLNWLDDWTATTVDGKNTAQFEHTLLITEDGVEALTAKNKDSMLQFWERESKYHTGFWLGTSKDAKKRAEEINSGLLLDAAEA